MNDDSLLWASGAFTLRIAGPNPGDEPAVVTINQPFAVLGRTGNHLITIDDPAVSVRHVYFHLDPRGLFAVDLATRTGTRVGPEGEPSGWLHEGDWLEVAGRKIEVLSLAIDSDVFPDGLPKNPLDDAGDTPLPRLTLFPEESRREPLLLNSEFVFVGRSLSCGVPVQSASAMKVHCVLVRGLVRVFVVDLVGRGIWRNDLPVKNVSPLADGDSLMIGSSRFQCRIDTPGTFHSALPAVSLGVGTSTATPSTRETFLEGYASSPPLHLIPPDAQAAVLGWMMGQIQARQDESNRRQADFQTDLVRLVAEIHRDNHAVLSRQNATAHIPALAAPKLPPLKIIPTAPPDNPEAAASWLIARVNQLDQENRKGWKDLLGRLAGRKEE